MSPQRPPHPRIAPFHLAAPFAFALVLCAAGAALARVQSAPAAKPGEAVYVAALRTPAHVNRSNPEAFHDTVDAVLALLKSKNVAIVADPSRPMIESADAIPVATLLNAARDANATSLLVLTVDRPATSWLKLSIEAYDISGKSLWEEHASYTGGVNSGKAVEDVMAKITRQLAPRFGKPGLPLAPPLVKHGDPPA